MIKWIIAGLAVLFLLHCIVPERVNILRVGATRKGKTLSCASDVVNDKEAANVECDPHEQSLVYTTLLHKEGNVLYDNLSQIETTIGYEFLVPSWLKDRDKRLLQNQKSAEEFTDILMIRRDGDGLGSTPLMEEWTLAAINLWLYQRDPKPLWWLPYAFRPDSEEFDQLVEDCTVREFSNKFKPLKTMTPRARRAEIGSASRLVNSALGSIAFKRRCRGGFNLGAFLQQKGTLLVERGDSIGHETMRAIMGSLILKTIEHAKSRSKPWPPIYIRIDEATNAALVTKHVLKGLAETNKSGLYWDLLVQNLDFPGGADAVLQNCWRHEFFGCPNRDLAHKAAVDILTGLPHSDESRSQRLEQLTNEIANLPPGWRWVRDGSGSRKEYVPMLEHPYPDWPGLREAKLEEKIQWILARPEYGVNETTESGDSSPATPPRRPKSPQASSAAERWKREREKLVGSSKGSKRGKGSRSLASSDVETPADQKPSTDAAASSPRSNTRSWWQSLLSSIWTRLFGGK